MNIDIEDIEDTYWVSPSVGKVRIVAKVGNDTRELTFPIAKLDLLAVVLMAAAEQARTLGTEEDYARTHMDGDIAGTWVDVKNARLMPLPAAGRIGLQALLRDGSLSNLALPPSVASCIAEKIPDQLRQLESGARKPS